MDDSVSKMGVGGLLHHLLPVVSVVLFHYQLSNCYIAVGYHLDEVGSLRNCRQVYCHGFRCCRPSVDRTSIEAEERDGCRVSRRFPCCTAASICKRLRCSWRSLWLYDWSIIPSRAMSLSEGDTLSWTKRTSARRWRRSMLSVASGSSCALSGARLSTGPRSRRTASLC